MIAYRPFGFAPIALKGRLGQNGVSTVAPTPPAGPGTVKAVATIVGLASLTLSAATAWVGYTAAKEKAGWLKAAGWVVGIGGALGGLMTLAQIGVVLAASPEEIRAMAARQGLET